VVEALRMGAARGRTRRGAARWAGLQAGYGPRTPQCSRRRAAPVI